MFGAVERVLLIPQKGQAFVQLETLEAATLLLTHYKGSAEGGANVGGRTAFFEYSQRNEISTPKNVNGNFYDKNVAPSAQGHQTTLQGSSSGAGTILHVAVSQMMYPMTVDTMHQVFNPFGFVQRIVTFTKNEQWKALVQFEHAAHAAQACNLLNGQHIFNGCNLMAIQISNLERLSVKYNNEKSFDYTLAQQSSAGAGAGGMVNSMGMGIMQPPPPSTPTPMGGGGGYGVPMMDAQGYAPQMGYGEMAMYGGMAPAAPQHGSVIIISGLPAECTPDILFTLFGVYGDITRIKIMFNKRDTGLIQFFDGAHAQMAAANLNGTSLFGSVMRVNESKHSQISMPSDGQFPDGQGETMSKDYSTSNLHRYRRGVKNAKNICPPGPRLHISNIPISAQDTDAVLKPLFQEYGEVTSFSFFEKDRRMAIVELVDVAAATHALIGTHNKLVNEGNIKVSFSKSSGIKKAASAGGY